MNTDDEDNHQPPPLPPLPPPRLDNTGSSSVTSLALLPTSPNDPGKLLARKRSPFATDTEKGELENSDDDDVSVCSKADMVHARKKIKELERIVASRDEVVGKLKSNLEETREELTKLRWVTDGKQVEGKTKKKNARKNSDWTMEENAIRSDVAHIVRTEICRNLKYLPPGWDEWTDTPKTLCKLFRRRLGLGDDDEGRRAWYEIVAPYVKVKMSDYRQYVNKGMKEEWSKLWVSRWCWCVNSF
jgi:hypothetical protein